MADSPRYSPIKDRRRSTQELCQQLGPPILERLTSGETQQDTDGSYSRVYLRCKAELPMGQSLAVLGTSSFTHTHTHYSYIYIYIYIYYMNRIVLHADFLSYSLNLQ